VGRIDLVVGGKKIEERKNEEKPLVIGLVGL
jgi:hypothetical protein